mmetsp:Transcript_2297/g.8919  ORF Transcript_2297/g.8919 Transcript_2297/m.8919 type:complete len:327 (-) Transcript_2297:135-1115(-)
MDDPRGHVRDAVRVAHQVGHRAGSHGARAARSRRGRRARLSRFGAPRVLPRRLGRLVREPAPVDEEVGLRAGEGQRKAVVRQHGVQRSVVHARQRGHAHLPPHELAGGREGNGHVVGHDAPVVGGEEVAALAAGDGTRVPLERVRVDFARAARVEEPVDGGAVEQEHTAQDERLHSRGVLLGVREGEGRSPAAPNHNGPLVHLGHLFAQSLDVGNQVPGLVGLGDLAVGPAAPRAALVEDDDAVELGVKQPRRVRPASGPGASVEVHCNVRGVRLAGHLVENLVPVPDVHVARLQHLSCGKPLGGSIRRRGADDAVRGDAARRGHG